MPSFSATKLTSAIDMASLTTNYAEIQRDEMEALRSIYMDDFEEEEVKTGAWNVGYNASNTTHSHTCSP